MKKAPCEMPELCMELVHEAWLFDSAATQADGADCVT